MRLALKRRTRGDSAVAFIWRTRSNKVLLRYLDDENHMQASGIHHAETILLALLLLVAVLAFAAQRVSIPYPIMLVLGGLLLSLIPEMPRVTLNPDIVFLVFLPPLIFSAAFHTSWREFRKNFVSILMLAFGLVGFTVFGVALVTRWLLPGFDWKLGLVLGSVVATTDPISATAAARRLGLPRKIIDLIEAESLVNDGSGLVALKFTAALLITGVTPTLWEGLGQLFYLITAGVAVGLVVGVLADFIQRKIADAPIEITISLITPFLSYLAAESLGCSGVLATIACGVYLGRKSSGYFSLQARIESRAVWNTLDFILNGIVFLLLGLQLPGILAEIRDLSLAEILVQGSLFVAVVILLRLLWVYPGAYISAKIRRHLRLRQVDHFNRREIFIVGWSGMRGVLALAAASSLPERLANGLPFPRRNLIIFLTFCVIFVTLVVQGLSLPVLIRRLALSGKAGSQDEEELARREMISAALAYLEKLRQQDEPERSSTYDQIENFYQRRLALLDQQGPDEHRTRRDEIQRSYAVSQQLRDVERSAALRLRNENLIHDEVLRVLEHELDLLDARFAQSVQQH
jgi:monovalent cation/hydrogen antiporter